MKGACLYLATKIGDLLDDLVIVGGLVPSLLVDQKQDRVARHVGTNDLDLGMEIAILDNKRYETLTKRLRAAGFGPDENENGNRTRQRWMINGPAKVTLDFMIGPTRAGDRAGQLRDIEDDFAAIIAPGLRLAFKDRVKHPLGGRTIRDEEGRREVWVCEAGAFIIMKAFALRNRGENKDAYDIAYLLQNYGRNGPSDVSARLAPLMNELEAKEAVRMLAEDFETVDSIGPRRVAEFLHDDRNEGTEADAWGAVQDLLEAIQK